MWSSSFWRQTAERALKSFAQALILGLGTGGVGLLSIGWKQLLISACLYTLLSVLTSIGSSGFGPSDGPSLVSTEPATE